MVMKRPSCVFQRCQSAAGGLKRADAAEAPWNNAASQYVKQRHENKR